MCKCCIFDLDGTLINSIKAMTHTMNLTLQKYGLAPINDDNCKVFVGDGYKKFVERSLIYSGDKDLINYEDAINTYSKLFEIHCLHDVYPYDGIKEMLEFLKSKDIKIAVLSNKPHKEALDSVYNFFGEDYFDIVSGQIEGTPIKPAPDGAILIANKLNISPKDCLYIGDTNTDMKTGASANMDTVGVTWGFRPKSELEEYNPKFIIDDPSEIIEIIKG